MHAVKPRNCSLSCARLAMALLAFALIALASLALTGCAAPATNGAAGETASDTQGGAATPPDQKNVRTGGRLPPEPVEEGKPGATVALDMTCKTDADCTVKDVGNCCGYYPACVNVDSPTDPEGVKAQCARSGMASVCGFQEIASCSCRQGRCEASDAAVQ